MGMLYLVALNDFDSLDTELCSQWSSSSLGTSRTKWVRVREMIFRFAERTGCGNLERRLLGLKRADYLALVFNRICTVGAVPLLSCHQDIAGAFAVSCGNIGVEGEADGDFPVVTLLPRFALTLTANHCAPRKATCPSAWSLSRHWLTSLGRVFKDLANSRVVMPTERPLSLCRTFCSLTAILPLSTIRQCVHGTDTHSKPE